MTTKRNHAADVAAMAKLAGYQPDHLAGFRIGDAVRLPNIEATFEVIGLADPLLILRSPSGKEIKTGWRCVKHAATHRRRAG